MIWSACLYCVFTIIIFIIVFMSVLLKKNRFIAINDLYELLG